jgi:hypothetical protein
MTNLFGNAKSHLQDELSSRPVFQKGCLEYKQLVGAKPKSFRTAAFEAPGTSRNQRRMRRRIPSALKGIIVTALCSLSGRIVEEELIAVGIVDHRDPVAPRTLLDRNAPGLEFRAQSVQRGDRGLARRRLDVEGNEHQPLATRQRVDPLSEVLALMKPQIYISGGFAVLGDMAIHFPKHLGTKCRVLPAWRAK